MIQANILKIFDIRWIECCMFLENGEPPVFRDRLTLASRRRCQMKVFFYKVVHAESCLECKDGVYGCSEDCITLNKVFCHMENCNMEMNCNFPLCSIVKLVLDHNKSCKINECFYCRPTPEVKANFEELFYNSVQD